jgi:alpha-galactosidase
MTIEGCRARRALRLTAGAALVLLAMTLTACKKEPNLTGKWTGPEKLLLNGETNNVLLQMTQTGNALTAQVQTPAFKTEMKGTVSGSHFELTAPWYPEQPFAVGDLVGSDLHVRWDGDNDLNTGKGQETVLHPATAAEVFPEPAYIAPPAIKPVGYNELAKKPPMGWNSWNLFGGSADDAVVRGIADAMVTSGMRDAGYTYVNIDDTWEGTRDAQGNIRPNRKFPDMKALAKYVHSKGLKLGIYSSPGPSTCGGYPASYGYEEQDAKTYASWGIDYLKYDWCSAGSIYKNDQLQPVYQKMGRALEETKRPIVFSLCEYGLGDVWKWGPAVGGNLWRTTGDILDEWDSMMKNIHEQVPSAPYAGPGHWNDPDMLEIGNGRMTNDEYRTHMSLWALSAAPLLAGNDIRKMSDATKSILLNKEVIAVDQDPLGKQATPVKNDNLETWIKPLKDGGVAVGVVNLDNAPVTATVKASDLPLKGSVSGARDLWAHTQVKFVKGEYSTTVAAHGTLMLRVR